MGKFKHLSREHVVIPTASGLADSQNTCIICKYCQSVGVCPCLSINVKNKQMVLSAF
jgi:formate hydrogenlyase subunit 6/NADH:ubiquinone oxidoreductase subunit I